MIPWTKHGDHFVTDSDAARGVPNVWAIELLSLVRFSMRFFVVGREGLEPPTR